MAAIETCVAIETALPRIETDAGKAQKKRKFDETKPPKRRAALACLAKLEEQKDESEGCAFSWSSLSWENHGVRIGISSIHGAGCGVFAQRDFEIGDVVCEYAGNVCVKVPMDTSYVLQLSSGFYLDGFRSSLFCAPSKKRNVGSIINDSRTGNDNCAFLIVDGRRDDCIATVNENSGKKTSQRAFIAATQFIQVGAELLVSYGPDYWLKHGNTV
jgi:hypothetical protein